MTRSGPIDQYRTWLLEPEVNDLDQVTRPNDQDYSQLPEQDADFTTQVMLPQPETIH